MNVYRAACKMVEQSPLLRKRLRIMRGTNRIVKRNDPDSFYAAIAADGDFGDGVNPSCVIADAPKQRRTATARSPSPPCLRHLGLSVEITKGYALGS